MVSSWKIFYTLEGIVRWISPTLIFYIKNYKNKQAKPYDPTCSYNNF